MNTLRWTVATITAYVVVSVILIFSKYKIRLTNSYWNSKNASLDMVSYQMQPFCQLYDSEPSFNRRNSEGNRTTKDHCSDVLNRTEMISVEYNQNIDSYLNRIFSARDLQDEKFTVVIPTFKRIKSLLSLIRDLNGTSNLDKVIVIWNDPSSLPEKIRWPKIDVRVQVLTNGRNSLNNKNLPLPEIETEAILHHDDDINLSQEEILSAFRVWQVNRENMVGYFRRSIVYNKEEKSYQYHMMADLPRYAYPIVLAGCCFVSKYYSFMYSFEMPHEIRDFVDKNMNGEDLALSFLVAHNIQKRPVLVTVKGSISQRKGGGKALHGRPGHYKQRDSCANEFFRIYGYMPLIAVH